MLCFSSTSGASGELQQQKKQHTVAGVTHSAEEVKYENLPWAFDAQCTESQSNNGLKFADKPRSVKLCTCNCSNGSSKLTALDNVEDLGRGNEILDLGRKASEDEADRSSDDVHLHLLRRMMKEQQFLQRPVRPRSLEVTHHTKVNTDSHQYENLAQFFRVAPQASSGNCLDVHQDSNREDTESENSSSTAAATPVGRIVSSSSVDTAIGRTMCRCNDVDFMSYQLAHNSVELESAAAGNPVGVSSMSSEHCFYESRGTRMMANCTMHCSRPPGEISLLNEDLLKYAQHTPRSVSMPVDIVPSRRLPPDHRVGNSLASGVNNVASQGQQLLQPTSSGCSVPQSVETKAARKRAYNVGLNLFNR